MKNIRRSRLCNNCLEKIYFQAQVGTKYCDTTNLGFRINNWTIFSSIIFLTLLGYNFMIRVYITSYFYLGIYTLDYLVVGIVSCCIGIVWFLSTAMLSLRIPVKTSIFLVTKANQEATANCHFTLLSSGLNLTKEIFCRNYIGFQALFSYQSSCDNGVVYVEQKQENWFPFRKVLKY